MLDTPSKQSYIPRNQPRNQLNNSKSHTDIIYWLRMSKDIRNFVEQCETCNQFCTRQQKQPLIQHPIPSRPWEKVAVDISTINSKDYLCTVDYYSDVFEVDSLSHKKDAMTITKTLKKHFSNHGIPEIVLSDNGPPFSSSEFTGFASDYQFEHITSSPGYPQSNGKVQNSVKTAKRLLRKTESERVISISAYSTG